MLRSIIFAPGNQDRKIAKAIQSTADAVAIDLEDSVPQHEKVAAAHCTAQHLSQNQESNKPIGRDIFVRINGLDQGLLEEELKVIVQSGLKGIILPMVENANELMIVDKALNKCEQNAGMDTNQVILMPLIETCKGLSDLRLILMDPPKRLGSCHFGAWDYSRDAGINAGDDEAEFSYARARIVIESRAAGLSAPIDASYAKLGDLEGLASSSRRARRQGFIGKACIHPEQIDIVNECFSPTAEELELAREIIAAMAKAEKDNIAAVRVQGRFVDQPMLEQARDLLNKFD